MEIVTNSLLASLIITASLCSASTSTLLKVFQQGPILLVSFTNHSYRLKIAKKGLVFMYNGTEFTGYGMFAALSVDEGKTGPVKKLLIDGKSRLLDGGAWTDFLK